MSERLMSNENSSKGENRLTIIVTITLLIILIIFFAGYSIVNGKNLDNLKGDYELYTEAETTQADIVSYSNLDPNTTKQNNSAITGNIESSENNYFKINSENPIAYTEPLYEDSEDIKIDMNKKETTTNNNKKTNTTKPKKITKEELINNPKIYNIKGYEKNDIEKDPYINKDKPYIIQISTHNNKKTAEQIKDILYLKGYNSYILKTKINNVIKYRIRTGAYSTKAEAITKRKKMVSGTNIKGMEYSIILYKNSFNDK